MTFNASGTKTGNQLLAILCAGWLVFYFAGLFTFAWQFLALGLMIIVIYQVDRMVIAGRNAESEDDVPGVLRKGVNVLFGLCLLLAAGEFLLAVFGR